MRREWLGCHLVQGSQAVLLNTRPDAHQRLDRWRGQGEEGSNSEPLIPHPSYRSYHVSARYVIPHNPIRSWKCSNRSEGRKQESHLTHRTPGLYISQPGLYPPVVAYPMPNINLTLYIQFNSNTIWSSLFFYSTLHGRALFFLPLVTKNTPNNTTQEKANQWIQQNSQPAFLRPNYAQPIYLNRQCVSLYYAPGTAGILRRVFFVMWASWRLNSHIWHELVYIYHWDAGTGERTAYSVKRIMNFKSN